MPQACTIAGSLKVMPDLAPEEICARFMADLGTALAPSGVPDGLKAALTLHARSAIDVDIALARSDNAARIYPRLTVDALDRALNPADVTRLAEAAAGMLTGEARGNAPHSTTPNKRS